ncbi:MAG: hypothetical protein ACJ79S_01770, partial [Gemmatimonadaceae bacterium]
GRQTVSRTWPGRLLDQLVGLERKERIAFALARLGLASRERRLYVPGDRYGAATDGEAAPPRTLTQPSP